MRQARSDDILAAARAHLAEAGMDGFSLRAIARRLELAPNSLYNYFPSLDDLITALILDAAARLATTIERVAQNGSWSQRFRAICLSYRQWAVTHPVDYNLIFGNPIPGYHAPAERTNPVISQSFICGLHILAGAVRDGQLTISPRYQHVPPTVADSLKHFATGIDEPLPPALIALMFTAWSRLHGMLMLEIHGHDDTALGDPGAFYAHNVDCLIAELGFHPS
jgi:AcrR family transcriptional regulator